MSRLPGSHIDRRRRRWALEHAGVGAAPRQRWWQQLLERAAAAFATWRSRAPQTDTRRVEPLRPVYGRAGKR